jgi:hypothetical protein
MIVGIYSGSQWYGTYQAGKDDDAFVALESAKGTMGDDGIRLASPASLLAVADEHAGRGAVALLAQLEAADIYLGAVRRGIAPGADLNDVQPDEMLNDEQTEELLGQAGSLYDSVAQRTASSDARTVLYIRSMLGAASVAISRHDLDTARDLFTKLAARAEEMGFTAQAAEARNRIETLGNYAEPFALYRESQINSFENDPFTERLDEEHLLLQPLPPEEVPQEAIEALQEQQRQQAIQQQEGADASAAEGEQSEPVEDDESDDPAADENQPADEPSDPSDGS